MTQRKTKTQTEQAQNHDLVQTLRICDTTNYTHPESHSHFPGTTMSTLL